ncbi:MAG: hypothetical protein KDB79_02670 [Acidobacteria bacterium]|nr:hypothetical protein [Acidobacteriota bacterium]
MFGNREDYANEWIFYANGLRVAVIFSRFFRLSPRNAFQRLFYRRAAV